MTEVDMRECWQCGQKTSANADYCEHCGAHKWNSGPNRSIDDRRSATEPAVTTAAGVLLIASILVLAFWFWVAILVMSLFWEPEGGMLGIVTFLDYLAVDRLTYATLAAVAMLFVSWGVAYKVVESE